MNASTNGRRLRPWPVFVTLALIGPTLVGCDEIVVDEPRVGIDRTGTVRGTAFVDLNENGISDAGDGPLGGVEIRVVQPVGGGAVALSTTEADGSFLMQDVPVGTYRLDVDPTVLADSLEASASGPFVVAADSVTTVNFRASLSILTVAEVKALEPGVSVYTSGVALDPRDAGAPDVHLRQGGDYLRTINVGATPVVTPGDSVRMQGRTALEAGLPVLEDVQVVILSQGGEADEPVPVDLLTTEAATAKGGTLNAALTRVLNADILATSTVDGDLVVQVDDGSGPVDLILRDYLGFDDRQFSRKFSSIAEARGLLVAELDEQGGLRWRLVPRFPEDVILE